MSNSANSAFYTRAEKVAGLAETLVDRYRADQAVDTDLAALLMVEAESTIRIARVQAIAELTLQNIEEIAATAHLIDSLNLDGPRLQYAMSVLEGLSNQLIKIIRSFGSSSDVVIPVRIYVEDTSVGPIVEAALRELLAEVGIGDVEGPTALLGSWYRRMFATIKVAGKTHTGEELRRAAEIQLIDRFQAGIDEATAGAVANLIAALGDTKGAVIQTGSVLLVKVDDNIIVRQLTPEQLLHWHMNPGIFQDPVAALAELQRPVRTEVGPSN